jgi:hypothetical protein
MSDTDAHGTFSGIDITDLSADALGGFAAFSGARSGGCSATTTSLRPLRP